MNTLSIIAIIISLLSIVLRTLEGYPNYEGSYLGRLLEKNREKKAKKLLQQNVPSPSIKGK